MVDDDEWWLILLVRFTFSGMIPGKSLVMSSSQQPPVPSSNPTYNAPVSCWAIFWSSHGLFGDLPIFRTGAKCDGWNQGAIWPYFIILENKKSFDDDGRWWTNMWLWVGISSGDGLSGTNFGLTVFSKGKIGIWIGESCEKSPDFFVRGRASICANHDPAINEILGLGKGWHLGRWDLYRWGKPFLVVVCFPRPLHKPSWFLVMGLNMFEPFWWISRATMKYPYRYWWNINWSIWI